MLGREAVEIKRFGLTQVYFPKDESTAAACIVFVHGLFGHPQRTWTGHKEPERSMPTSTYRNSNASNTHCKRAGETCMTERLSLSPDCPEKAPGATHDTLPGCASIRGSETPHSSMMEPSQILGLQPGEVFWPEAILPSVLPETRIFTWGYDADVDAFNTSVGHNNVEQHANDLLVDVANLLEKLGDLVRPIIFVVHSLGGIIVKEALNIASQSEIERLRRVPSVTYGISFLGTPHRGSGSATIGKHAYRIARLATKRPNIKLLRSLEKNSDTLKGISNRFRSTQQRWDIKISSFYEDREVRKFFLFHSLIVDNESAQIGHAGEEVSSIPKNHREMTKFTSSEEVGFDRVSSQLRRWVQVISASSEASGNLAQELEDCLSSLENSQTRARYINVASSYDGTFQWLFNREIVPFVDWLEEDQDMIGPSRPIFWINGKPGSGKSTLMKFAMRDKRTQACLRTTSGSAERIILGFFFHDRGSHIQKSIEGMLQAVLHQLVSQVPTLLDFVYPIYTELVQNQRKSSPVWTFDSLCAAWVAVTQQRTAPLRVCLFLDALDEHDGDNSQLANFIYQLLSGADGKVVRIKICVASRRWNIFGEHFGTSPQFPIHEHTAGDIQAYSSERLSAPVMSLGDEARLALSPKVERLSSQVTTKARGVFIWIRIVVDELVKGIRDGTALSLLEEKVSMMPEELGDLYRHTLERISPDYIEEAYIMLQITLCSLTALPIETFMKCVSFTRWGKIHEASEEEMIRQLISRSGGLLEIIEIVGSSTEISERVQSDLSEPSEDVHHSSINSHQDDDYLLPDSGTYEDELRTTKAVQFIHQTMKDYVAENRSDLGLRLSDSTFKGESGHLYLLDWTIRFGAGTVLSRSMLEHAFLAETDGLSDASRIRHSFDPVMGGNTTNLNLKGWIMQELPQYKYSLAALNPYVQFVVLAAAADLKGLISYEISTVGDQVKAASKWILAMVATGPRLSTTSPSRESMVKLLLKAGLDIDMTTNGVELEDFQVRSGTKGEEIITYLDAISRTTLSWLLRQESQKYILKEEAISLARLLLENGANPNTWAVPDSSCPQATSLLYSCILHYDIEAVKLLLLHEADTLVIDHQLVFNIWVTEKIRRETTMSDLLREYDFNFRWGPELMSTPALLVMQSGWPVGIGSSEIGTIVGWAHRKTGGHYMDRTNPIMARAATWGTRRRSEPTMEDFDAVADGSYLRNLR